MSLIVPSTQQKNIEFLKLEYIILFTINITIVVFLFTLLYKISKLINNIITNQSQINLQLENKINENNCLCIANEEQIKNNILEFNNELNNKIDGNNKILVELKDKFITNEEQIINILEINNELNNKISENINNIAELKQLFINYVDFTKLLNKKDFTQLEIAFINNNLHNLTEKEWYELFKNDNELIVDIILENTDKFENRELCKALSCNSNDRIFNILLQPREKTKTKKIYNHIIQTEDECIELIAQNKCIIDLSYFIRYNNHPASNDLIDKLSKMLNIQVL
jgi:hypothetical protein